VNTPVKSLSNLLKSSLKRVEREISKNIKDEEKLITLTAGHLIKAKGKKIRPLLTLIVSKMLNYKGNADVTLAVCIEFIHNATLLHDDVIDTGKIRRGKLSANQIWGNKVSVLVGDYLLSRAFKLMVKNKVAIITGGAKSNILLIMELRKAKNSNLLSSIRFK